MVLGWAHFGGGVSGLGLRVRNLFSSTSNLAVVGLCPKPSGVLNHGTPFCPSAVVVLDSGKPFLEAELPVYFARVLKSLCEFVLPITQELTIRVPGLLGHSMLLAGTTSAPNKYR